AGGPAPRSTSPARTDGPPATAPRRAGGASSASAEDRPGRGGPRVGREHRSAGRALLPRESRRGGERALDARRAAFERHLARVLPAARATPSRLHQAMRYAALAPGKRLRPMLVLTACEAAGGRW